MLKIFHQMREIPFGELMDLYSDSNRRTAQAEYPHLDLYDAILQAEQDFYQYLQQCFFRTEGAVYAIWQVQGRPVSALRLEPYRDGLLLEALETAPDERRQGYAKMLIGAALELYVEKTIYSHISKRNIASQLTHEACGFRKILEHAVYADGSVMHSSGTWCHE